MKEVKPKAFAYITYAGQFLLFRHVDDPESGIQVPAGTVKPNETPALAALREAQEETGLESLTLVSYLGEQVRDMSDFGKDEIHHRYFYHLRCTQPPPLVWQHEEPDASEVQGSKPLFSFFWAPLPDQIPVLIADHGVMLPILLQRIEIQQTENG
jgi:8-oxo-dGTP pyrophosphatase MutT (NUDIX family)